MRSQLAEGSKINSSLSYLPWAKKYSFVYIRCHLSCTLYLNIVKSLYALPQNNSELNLTLNLHFGRFATRHAKTTLFYYLPVYVW